MKNSVTYVVIIGYVWPEPNSSAAGYHMLSFIRLFLAQGWQVTFASPAALSEHRFDLTSLGVEEVSITLNDTSFDTWISQQQPDIVLFDRFMMEEQFGWRVEQACPTALRLLDTEDLHSLRDARHRVVKRALKEGQDPDFNALLDLPSLFAEMTHQDMSQREIASIYRADLTLMISDAEQTLLQQQFAVPPALLHHCPFMRPPNHEDSLTSFADRQHFVSIGNFRHAPNWDAVLWLKQQIWPLIRHQLPAAELHIYGAYPPPKATALHKPKEGFYIKGWADNADHVLQTSRVLLAPLRFGAGIKGKLLDAMRNGTPSVTTPIGSEGMLDENSQWPGIIAQTPQEIADSAVTLYQDEALWNTAQSHIQPLISARFNQTAIETSLITRIQTLLDTHTLQQHRHSNFTGQMLRHHHHKSTQYMAQWIEAKNKLNSV